MIRGGRGVHELSESEYVLRDPPGQRETRGKEGGGRREEEEEGGRKEGGRREEEGGGGRRKRGGGGPGSGEYSQT